MLDPSDSEGNIAAASPQASSEAVRAIREDARLGHVMVWGRLDAPIGNIPTRLCLQFLRKFGMSTR